MNLIHKQIINVVQFDKTSLTVHYILQDGVAGNYKIKMVDEKTNGYFYYEDMYLEPNITYWSSCPFILNYIYKNVKIIFEFDNQIVFEKSYVVYDTINKNCLSDLYFYDYSVCINTYYEVFVFKTYSQYGISIEENDIVVDIGANVGASIKLALDNKCKKIYCCEPNPVCIDVIKKYYGENKNLIIDQYAICNSSGFSELMIPSNGKSTGSAKITQSTTSTDYSTCTYIQIKTLTFKDFIAKNKISKIDFLKVDCEGGEEFIFNETNIEYIKTNVHKIAVEYHTSNLHQYIQNLLNTFGFETHVLSLSDQIGLIYARNKNYNIDSASIL
jgi:FkbM family methyltransferase